VLGNNSLFIKLLSKVSVAAGRNFLIIDYTVREEGKIPGKSYLKLGKYVPVC